MDKIELKALESFSIEGRGQGFVADSFPEEITDLRGTHVIIHGKEYEITAVETDGDAKGPLGILVKEID
jgi:hypothetical protein